MSSILQELEQQIAGITSSVEKTNVGTVRQVGDGVAKVEGLSDVMLNEMIEFGGGVTGMALNLEESEVGVVLLGDYAAVKEGSECRTTGKLLSVPVGEAVLGRVVNALGATDRRQGRHRRRRELSDGKNRAGHHQAEVRFRARADRHHVHRRDDPDRPRPARAHHRRPRHRQDHHRRGHHHFPSPAKQGGGKGKLQNHKPLYCIYVAIGQKLSNVARIHKILEDAGAMEYTTIVSASASDAAAMQYLAPYAGCAIAEYFMDQGKDCLIVFDDLSKHAVAYRQVSLILRRPSGREAYPGDVFYLHSRLLERSARLSEAAGGGSLTALPIIETQAGDVSAYIPTNVISITDGQIYLETDLFYQGIRPAISVGLSVSRVGSAAQTKTIKSVAGTTKLDLAQYRELQAFAQFGSDLDASTKKKLDRGARIVELFKQNQYSPLAMEMESIYLFAMQNGYFDDVAVADVKRFQAALGEFFNTRKGELLDKIRNEKPDLKKDAAMVDAVKQGIEDFKKSWK